MLRLPGPGAAAHPQGTTVFHLSEGNTATLNIRGTQSRLPAADSAQLQLWIIRIPFNDIRSFEVQLLRAAVTKCTGCTRPMWNRRQEWRVHGYAKVWESTQCPRRAPPASNCGDLFVYLFMRNKERERETQAAGEAGSLRGPRRGPRFRDPGVTP